MTEQERATWNAAGAAGDADVIAALQVDVEDCSFRMLEPHEVKAAMAFAADYHLVGNKRDQVRQLGNGVTPPVMGMIVRRLVDALEGQVAA